MADGRKQSPKLDPKKTDKKSPALKPMDKSVIDSAGKKQVGPLKVGRTSYFALFLHSSNNLC
jgi:hypothetical protein